MALNSKEKFRLINKKAQDTTSDDILITYSIDLYTLLFSDESLRPIYLEIISSGIKDKRRAVLLEKIIIYRLNKICKEIKDYCKYHDINLDLPEKLIVNRFSNDYILDLIVYFRDKLIDLLDKGKKHHQFVFKFLNFKEKGYFYSFKKIEFEDLDKIFEEIFYYAKAKKLAVPFFWEDYVNFFNNAPNDDFNNKRRNDIINELLDSIFRKGNSHFLFLSKYMDINIDFRVLRLKAIKEYNEYLLEIRELKRTLRGKIWYKLDILFWLYQAYHTGDLFIEKNIEKIDLPIYYSLIHDVAVFFLNMLNDNKFSIKLAFGFSSERFKTILDSIAMYIDDYKNEEVFVQSNSLNKELSFDESTGILFINGIPVDFSGALLEIEFVGLFFPLGNPLKSEKGLSRFDVYKDLYVDEKDLKNVKPESFSNYDYKKLYTLKDSVNSKIKKETKENENFFIVKNKYINLNKNI